MALFDPKAKVISGYQRSIDERSSSIRKYYDEIGKLYYDQYKDMNVDNTKDINTRCEAITRLSNEIEEYKLKILFEKGLKKCPNCGTENSLEYGFCFKCGSKFDEDSAKEPKTEFEKAEEKFEEESEKAAETAEEAEEKAEEAAEEVAEAAEEEKKED
ncbi:MAG: zinc ribbon domain-containing protein [Clostridiales bacterium]|nr:zinc ribbon domain-containing protein [Clostridiales bacterium]